MIVYLLTVENLDLSYFRILGVFRSIEYAFGRVVLEEDVPADAKWKHYPAGDGFPASVTFENPVTGNAYHIERHPVEPFEAPPPRVGRRPGRSEV